MSTATLLNIILAGIAALLLALFQYLYKSNRNSFNMSLAFIRFITYFLILLLLINPKFERTTVYNEKPKLVVAVDNSESVKHLERTDQVNAVLDAVRQDEQLNSNFDLEYFQFGTEVNPLDSLSFDESESDINKIFKDLSQVYKDANAPMILITDGNQTLGTDYEYGSKSYKHPIFPVVLGDSTTYSDLKIEQLNVNKYAYLKNRLPVEVFITYSGNAAVNSQLVINSGNARVFTQNLSFSESENSKLVNLTLPANRVGVVTYTATIVPLDNEKNRVNNSKPFAVEVIDQKTNVAIVSAMIHPDLGALKKSIESNEQRTVDILKPGDFLRTMENYQLVILYQPNGTFRATMEAMRNANRNVFLITGTQTQWSFLNGIQDNFEQEVTSQQEDFQADLNDGYNTFIVDDLDFSSYPPLRSEFGALQVNIPFQTLLYKTINGNILDEPLLFTFEEASRREAVLIGENIWKWRAQSYLNNDNFETFDDFIGKLVQYLSSDRQRRRLTVNYESFYNGNSNIIISAQYFNKNYEFDNKANLEIILKNNRTDLSSTVPFVIRQNNYQVDLSGLDPGDYDFTVRSINGEASRSGSLTILNYNVEQQFLNANLNKLQAVAQSSSGKSFLIDQFIPLLSNLSNDSRFAIIQKSSKNVVPLIDFKILLGLLALSLATEWFIRKYNGLI